MEVILTKTRQHRRKAVTNILKQLKVIMDAETQYLDNIPENLQNSYAYDTTEEIIGALEEAIDLLDEAYLN